MASNTNNLGLLKKDPVADGNDTFNIRTMLNENWDKIDEFAGKTTPISKGGTGATTAAQALANLGGIAAGAVGNLHVWQRVQSGVTDYLTSTDRNAYPDQSAEGGQDAYYTLGDVVIGSLSLYEYTTSKNYVHWDIASDLSISDDGTVSLVSPTRVSISPTSYTNANSMLGKYIQLKDDAYAMYTTITPGSIFYIPSDAGVSSGSPGGVNKVWLTKYQPVTGHAAIPANTAITYLGQLGGGARIEVGSYVGTGTYGISNPNSLYVGTNCVKVEIRAIYSSDRIGSPFLELHPQAATKTWRALAYFRNGPLDSNSYMRIVDGVLYWYSNGAEPQGNEKGVQHTYSIFKK